MSKKKEYYVVVRGNRPGIYRHWSGAGGAAEQVKGFPGAVYKGFAALDDAMAWQRERGEGRPKAAAPRATGQDVEALLAEGKVVIYTDGGAIGNPGPGGYGVVLLHGDRRQELSGGFRHTTNNRMELRACIEALEALRVPSDVVLFSDSSYVVNAVTKGWLRRWQRNGWTLTTGEPVKNEDLWRELAAETARHTVEFRWVRGHAGTPENERADELAVAAARGPGLDVDHGFEAGDEEGAD